MPKRTDIRSILVIGSGPIVIGQACEFDYAGSQACKALRREGYRVILVNSNPATIMTDPDLADATYIEPLTPEAVAAVIARERPDALLPTMGGQTGLNVAAELARTGVLTRFGVELVGASAEVIARAEDRLIFRETMQAAGLDVLRSVLASSLEEAEAFAREAGYPVIVRPSFTLGGSGGGVAYNHAELVRIVRSGLAASPVRTVLVEESALGWKEFELEVMHDKAGNAVIVCSIENLDPMGVHTGDSITVAPCQTLTDREYQAMRNAALTCIRAVGVETGGANVQFAVEPRTGRMVVVEMNPRVSRSSALASKATGYPIAKVAALVAVGYTLDEIPNDITQSTPASFEPAVDYCVVKVPRFDFAKFPEAEPALGTQMKAVGEVMAIGRTFKEALQKALRSLEIGWTGLSGLEGQPAAGDVRRALKVPAPGRLAAVVSALRLGLADEEICAATGIDPWFVVQIATWCGRRRVLLPALRPKLCCRRSAGAFRTHASPKPSACRKLRCAMPGPRGAWNRRINSSIRAPASLMRTHLISIRRTSGRRKRAGTGGRAWSSWAAGRTGSARASSSTTAAYRRQWPRDGLRRGDGQLQPGNREHRLRHLRPALLRTAHLKTVLRGAGGEARRRHRAVRRPDTAPPRPPSRRRGADSGHVARGDPPGRGPECVPAAPGRPRLKQPPGVTVRSLAEARAAAQALGYPVLVRPSYVLGGRAMEIVYDEGGLDRYVRAALAVDPTQPVLIDKYLGGALELDVDAVSDGQRVCVGGILEHVEEAGVHSGDSACSLPATRLPAPVADEVVRQVQLLARALHVVGLMNVQFAWTGEDLYVLEVNPRASRTVPFVSKAVGVPLARVATEVMLGAKLNLPERLPEPREVAVKEAVFPFGKLAGVDPLLGPEMRSTGEVMAWGDDLPTAYWKAQAAAGAQLPGGGTVYVQAGPRRRPSVLSAARELAALGFALRADGPTAAFLRRNGVAAGPLDEAAAGRAMAQGDVQMLLSLPDPGRTPPQGRALRELAVQLNVPLFTTGFGAHLAAQAIAAWRQGGGWQVRSLQERVGRSRKPCAGEGRA